MKNQDIGKKARSGFYWSLGLKLIQQAFNFAVMIIVARILGPKAFGIMAITLTIISYMNSFTTFGLTSAIVQQSEMEEKTVKTIFTFNLLLSLLFMGLICGFSGPIARQFKAAEIDNYLKITSVLVPLSSFYSVPMALLRRSLKYKEHSIIDLVQSTTFSVVLLCMALLGFGVWALVGASIAGFTIAVMVLIIYIGWRPRLDFQMSRLKGLMEYGFWDLVRFHIAYIEENAPNIVISRNLNLVTLGYFERSNSIATMPMRKIQDQINSIVFSAFSRLRDDRERLLDATEKIFIMLSFLAFPGMIIFALVSPFFVHVFLGGRWIEMTGSLQLLCILSIFRIYSTALNNINVAIGAYRKHTLIGVVTSLALVVMCVIGVRYGLNGIIAALFVYTVANVIAYSLVTCRTLAIPARNLAASGIKRLGATLAVVLLYILYYKFAAPAYTLTEMIIITLCMGASYILIELMIVDRKTKEIFASIKSDFRK